MRWRNIGWLAMLAMAVSGCGGLAGGSAQNVKSEDEYTILLKAFSGTGHMNDAQRYKENTEAQAGWKNLYVVSKSNSSELYWGQYTSIEEAQPNLTRAHAFTTAAGQKPYPKAIILKIPGKDYGPPELNLANAQGMYTVLVATFYDVPGSNYVGRKGFAVDYCKQLREQGVEAYYYHGLTQSIVTIGTFGESAIRKHEANDKTVTETYINDPHVKRILEEYPFIAENGRRMRVQVTTIERKLQWVDKRSYLIRIPRKEDNGSVDSFSYSEPR